jgi:HPt (histidine-containing phosphotransfer) domain-containing protein
MDEHPHYSDPAGEPPIDRERLSAVTFGDPEFEAELLAAFLGDTASAIERLATALSAGDLPAARREAHSIRGSAANVGALPLSAEAGRLETLLAGGGGAGAEAVLDRVRGERARVEATRR